MNLENPAMPSQVPPSDAAPQAAPAAPNGTRHLGTVRVDASHLAKSYCNVVTANGTRDEVVLQFGINQDWDLDRPEKAVTLHTRVVMNPHAARRLQARLSQVLADYEARFGGLQR